MKSYNEAKKLTKAELLDEYIKLSEEYEASEKEYQKLMDEYPNHFSNSCFSFTLPRYPFLKLDATTLSNVDVSIFAHSLNSGYQKVGSGCSRQTKQKE